MAIRLHADECVDARVVAACRRRGIDITSSGEQRLLGVSDERQLAYAIEGDRVIITKDHRFLKSVDEQLQAGMSFPGMIFIAPETSVGDAVRALSLLVDVLDASDLVNSIEWVHRA